MASTTIKADDDHLRPWLVGVISAMASLAVSSMALRLLSRRLEQQKLWCDDHKIISSAACNLFSAGLLFAMYSQGLGLPATAPSPGQTVLMAQLSLAARVLLSWNECLTKLAILLTYYRIFDLSRGAKASLFTLGGFVVLWSCICSFLFIFTCDPIRKTWLPDTPGHCIDHVGRWVANAASTVFTNLAIILFPIPQLWRLSLTRMDKFWVTLIFVQGVFVVAASICRFALLFSYTFINSYTLAPVTGWYEIEVAAGIVAANLPILKPVAKRVLLFFCGDEQQKVFFSGSSGWHTGGRKKLSVDSGPSAIEMTASRGGCSTADIWDWSRCVESNTRPVELAKNQHRATASKGAEQ